MDKIKLLGLSGRAGAGKSTIADCIGSTDIICSTYHNPWAYILACLFDWNYSILDQYIPITTDLKLLELGCSTMDIETEAQNDSIWNMGVYEAFVWTLNILQKLHPEIHKNLSTNFTAPNPNFSVVSDKEFVQISFADPLKKICAVFNHSEYVTLLGLTQESRELREQPKTDGYLAGMSGRQLLERVGTECFRSKDSEIWIKLAMRRIYKYNSLGIRVVIPDVRFRNEADAIHKMNGSIFVIARDEKDLVLTQFDQTTHVSKWEFLTFIDRKKDIIIINNKSIDDLKSSIKGLLGISDKQF